MKNPVTSFTFCLLLAGSSPAFGTLVLQTQHGAGSNDLDGSLASSDLLSGLIATELPGDLGWHPANPAASLGSLDPNGLPAFTNDSGEGGLAGLLNDFPGSGAPTKVIQYDLAGASDLERINLLTGNEGGDERVFSSTRILYSINHGATFLPLGGFVPSVGPNASGFYLSDPSGTLNPGLFRSTLVSIFDDGGGALASGVTNLQFQFFAVGNTSGVLRDPFDGLNPYTGVDDGFSAPIVAPLVWEIDAVEHLAIPEPAAGALLPLPLLVCALVLRRRLC